MLNASVVTGNENWPGQLLRWCSRKDACNTPKRETVRGLVRFELLEDH